MQTETKTAVTHGNNLPHFSMMLLHGDLGGILAPEMAKHHTEYISTKVLEN